MATTTKTKIIHKEKNSKHALLLIAVTFYLVMLILYPKSVSSGIKSGIDCCLDILIPSMFPFMVAAAVVTLSGIDEKFKSIFGRASKILFYLPSCTVPAIIMSLFGGYPIGAYCVKSLYKNKLINSEQMNRMMCFCVNFGPAFIISALGQMLLNNHKLGIILFLIQVFSSVLIGVTLGILARINKICFYDKKTYFKKSSFYFSEILISACNSASKSLLGVCCLVTLFFGIISVINELGIINYISFFLLKINIPEEISSTLILSVMEMTQSCILGAKNPATPYPIYSWIIGFGGLCAHMQIISQLKGCPFKYVRFLTSRIINGAFTAAITFAIIKKTEKTLQTFAPIIINHSAAISKASPTHFGSIILLIFCVFFTFSVCPFTNTKNS